MTGARRLRGSVAALALLAVGVLIGPHAAPSAAAQQTASQTDTSPTSPSSEGQEGLVPVGLVRELRQRTEALARREEALDERERSLEEVAAEARRLLDDLVTRREQVDERIAVLEALQGDGVGRLAKVYAAMPPASAAVLLEELEIEMASALLARIKPKRSAALLAALPPETALALTRSSVVPLPGLPSVSAPTRPSPALRPEPQVGAVPEQEDEP